MIWKPYFSGSGVWAFRAWKQSGVAGVLTSRLHGSPSPRPLLWDRWGADKLSRIPAASFSCRCAVHTASWGWLPHTAVIKAAMDPSDRGCPLMSVAGGGGFCISSLAQLLMPYRCLVLTTVLKCMLGRCFCFAYGFFSARKRRFRWTECRNTERHGEENKRCPDSTTYTLWLFTLPSVFVQSFSSCVSLPSLPFSLPIRFFFFLSAHNEDHTEYRYNAVFFSPS